MITKDNIGFIITEFITIISLGLLHYREIRRIKNQEKELKQKSLVQIAKVTEERNIAIKKLEYLPRIMSIKNPLILQKYVDEIFEKTRATRFLFLIGVNGKTSLNHVSCIWYKYKNPKDDINPIVSYKNIDISEDTFYKNMIHNLSKNPTYIENITTMKMPNSILKHIYFNEQVTYSKIGFVNRDKIDEKNDFLLYYSIASDMDDENGFTDKEGTAIKLIMDSKIKPFMEQLKNKKYY